MTREAQDQRDDEAYKANFERIFPRQDPLKAGRYMLVDGEWVPEKSAELPPVVLAKNDAKNIRSVGSGVTPGQAAEFNRRFSDMGAKADPRTGDVYYRDRNSKLAVLKARGFCDLDEVRG